VAKKVFIGYSHSQGEWVLTRLVPYMEAGGAEVLIDRERFKAGKNLIGQMDATQDKAQVHVLVFSPDYLSSPNCLHEMERAVVGNPSLRNGSVIPLKRVQCQVPAKIRRPNPLYVDLRNDRDPVPWELSLKACEADLGVAAPSWLKTRDDIVVFCGETNL
jgi:TIR domain